LNWLGVEAGDDLTRPVPRDRPFRLAPPAAPPPPGQAADL